MTKADGTLELCQKYMNCMEEIKKRVEVVRTVLLRRLNVMYVATTAETVALQLRKILELIALASLVANSEEYDRIKSNIAKEWNAKRILKVLREINPNFYPQPSEQVFKGKTTEGQSIYDTPLIESGFLTQEDFVALYDKCSRLMHADNPFSEDQQGDLVKFLNAEAPRYLRQITTLLNHHHVHPVDDDRMFITVMQDGKDGNVKMFEFRKVGASSDILLHD